MVGQSKLLDKLRELARNLWWTWQPEVVSLFRELDPALWRNVPNIAAAAVSGMLAILGVAAAIVQRAAPSSGAGRRPAGMESSGGLPLSASRPGEHAGKEQAPE